MLRRPSRSTRTDTLSPDTPLFRSVRSCGAAAGETAARPSAETARPLAAARPSTKAAALAVALAFTPPLDIKAVRFVPEKGDGKRLAEARIVHHAGQEKQIGRANV